MARKEKFNYFDALDRQAKLCCKEAELLIEVIENFKSADELEAYLVRAHEIEHSGDGICHEVYKSIGSDFITPIEREDIMAMTQSLDDVLDYLEGTIQRFYMLNVKHMPDEVLEFARLLLKSCEALQAAMEDFGNFKNSKKLRQLLIDVSDCEEEADALFMRVVHDLFTKEDANPQEVFVWDKIYQRMESTADTCERVADTMGSILLKNA